MAGFFPNEFWSTLILRAIFHEPVIKHAVLALSSLHECFSNGDRSILNPLWDKGGGGYALTQYNKAIEHLVKPAQKRPQAVDVCLVACMLFSSFETLRGHHGSALSHISSGVKILSEVRANSNGRQAHNALTVAAHPYVDLVTLEVFFNRLDSQVSQMVGTKPMILSNQSSDRAPGFCGEVPTTFSSIEEARNSKDYQWNKCMHLLNVMEPYGTHEEIMAVEPQLEGTRLEFSNVIRRWLDAFKVYLQDKRKSLDKREMRAARTLEMSQIFLQLYLEIAPLNVITTELGWDSFTARYEDIVELASFILEPTSNDHIPGKRRPEFSLDLSTVGPLFAVAHRCRHPIIRRKAVSLLYAVPRQEGIWDSVLAARVAEKIISIEEEGLGPITCAQDVPDWARLSGVDVKFDLHGRMGTVSYSRQRSSLDNIRETTMEVLKW